MKTIACVPTMSSRAGILPKMIESIKGQVDELHVVLNTPDNDLGSTGRFKFCPVTEDAYYFTCDDDLVYPPTYVQDTIRKIEEHKRKAVVAWHGRVIKKWPIERYSTPWLEPYACLNDVAQDTWVHIPGTGVMAFHTSTIRIYPGDFSALNNDDVEAAVLIQQAGVPILVPAHPIGYLKYLNPAPEDTIWFKDQNNGFKLQIKMINAHTWALRRA